MAKLPVDELLPMLRQESEWIGRLCGLLEGEQQALTAGKVDQLTEWAEEKGRLIAAIGEAVARRDGWLRAKGFATGKKGMDICLSPLPPQSEIRRLWLDLSGAVDRARELNELNGKLVAIRMQANARLLDALRSNPDVGGLYGSRGETVTGLSGRIIDSV